MFFEKVRVLAGGSNPTPSSAKPPVFLRKKRVPRRLWTTRWTTHQGSRQRTRAVDLFGQQLQACTCMDVQESQSNWPDIRITLGKPGFCSEQDRNRTFECFPDGFVEFESCLKVISSEAMLFIAKCMTSLLVPLGTTYVVQVLICGHPGTFGNLRSRRRSLTLSRHDKRNK